MQVGIHLQLRLRGTLPINITRRQSIYPDKLQMHVSCSLKKLKWVIVTTQCFFVEINYATAKRFKKNPRPSSVDGDAKNHLLTWNRQ